MNLKSCPDQESLRRLPLGKIALPQAEQLKQHLPPCDDCSAVADTISAGELGDGTDPLLAVGYDARHQSDVFALDTTLWFANYQGPQRMMMGDWSHAQMTADRARLSAISS